MFGLCRTCTEENCVDLCNHDEEERAFIGTWVTGEIKKAVEMGYQIKKIYEVWHFDQISRYDPVTKQGGIFTDYVNTFLKIKQEASGWPDWCKTEESKIKYINNYHDKEGIWLEYAKIRYNSGLRNLAKLMLNR